MASTSGFNAPKNLISDRGVQFTWDGFDPGCRSRGIRHRFGAVGKHGSIAIIERLMRTLKSECTRRPLSLWPPTSAYHLGPQGRVVQLARRIRAIAIEAFR